MLKKLFIGTAIIGGTSVLLLGSSVASYVRTGVHSIRQEVKSQIPVEVEIKRCRDMIQHITPEITGNMHVIAREEVEIEKLKAEVLSKREKLTKAKSQIIRLRDDLSQSKPHYVYAGRTYSGVQVRDDLSARFASFKSQESTVDQMEKILIAREQKLMAARNNLDEMLAAKRQLEVEVENLEARMTMVQVAQTSSALSLDSSQLSKTRELLSESATRIDVEERLAGNEGIALGLIPVEEVEDTDVLAEIAAYFDGNTTTKAEVMVDAKSGASLENIDVELSNL